MKPDSQLATKVDNTQLVINFHPRLRHTFGQSGLGLRYADEGMGVVV